jgi:hypothetical protein
MVTWGDAGGIETSAEGLGSAAGTVRSQPVMPAVARSTRAVARNALSEPPTAAQAYGRRRRGVSSPPP